MIDSVRFRNFKALRNVDVKLERFTVIVGPNGSGKSSILQGIHNLSLLRSGPVEQIFQGRRDPALLLSRGATESLDIEVSYDSPPGATAGLAITRKQSSDGWVILPKVKGSLIHRAAYLRLDPERLAEPASLDADRVEVGVDGRGLATVLLDMSASRPEVFQALQSALRAVVPQVERVRLQRARMADGDRQGWGYEIVFDIVGAPDVPAGAVSEGTLLVLGLLAVLFASAPPEVVLLDDLDRGIHPKAQRDLIVQLRKLLQQYPQMQIVATSHSPYLLDQFEYNEVRVTTLQDDGSVVCAGLDQHPDIERWRDVMRPGEFWSTVGEGWLQSRSAE